jgi:hypothetical protein
MPLAKLLFLPVVALLAVEIQVAAAELPLGMKTGIERFAQTHSGISAEPVKAPIANLPLSMLSTRNWWVRPGPADSTAVCSIPLREMRIDHPERFASREAELPGTLDEMPRIGGPASVCGAKFTASLR